MRKLWKHLIVFVMAALLTMGYCLTAQAADATTTTAGTLSADSNDGNRVTNTATVTITKPEGLTIPSGQTVSYTTYQIVYAAYDSASNSLVYHLTEWAKIALVGTSLPYGTEAEALEAISAISAGNGSTTGNSTTEQNTLVNTLAAYSSKTSYTSNFTQSGTSATATLPIGSYLVIANCQGMSFLNMMVSVDVSATSGTANNAWMLAAKGAVLKGSPVNVDKKIDSTVPVNDTTENTSDVTDTAAAGIGDTVKYEVTAVVPHFPENATATTFKVIDTPENLAIDATSVKVKAVKADNTEVPLTNSETNTVYTAVVDTQTGVLTVDFSNSYKSIFAAGTDGSYPYTSVKITYSAKVLESAKLLSEGTNKNSVKLQYTHDPYGTSTYDVQGPKPEVYTYGVTITKKEAAAATDDDSENGNAAETTLANAGFQIKKGDAVLVCKYISPGLYRISDNQSATTSDAASPAAPGTADVNKYYRTIFTGSDGTLTLIGLDASTDYTLQETVAPAGYSLNSETLTVNITADTTDGEPNGQIASVTATPSVTSGSSWSAATVDDTRSKAVFKVSLNDTKLPSLPATGGMGTTVFTIAGVLLMIAALLLFFAGKRKKEDRG